MGQARVIAGNPNAMSDRAAMGLPASFVARQPETLFSAQMDLLHCDSLRLVEIIEDPATALARRYAAGTLLGLIGDPRISLENPSMCSIPASRVELGLKDTDVNRVCEAWEHVGVLRQWIAKECPRYRVDLPAFALMRYPVSNYEYRLFLQDTAAQWLPSSWSFGVYPIELANHPVWSLPPQAADAYAAWLGDRTGRRFRLPSEAEWEYAASGGDGREHPWGQHFDPHAANTVEAGPLTTTPIGIFPAGRSPFGVDDMGGNVEEYVADNYSAYPGGETIDDDLLMTQGSYRVARGGSFTRFGDLTRCARRHGWYQRDIYAMGFRLAESL